MAIGGVITTRHVLRHAALIVRQFGPVAFLRCCLVVLRRKEDLRFDMKMEIAQRPESADDFELAQKIRCDLRALCLRAIRLTLEMLLDEEIRTVVGAGRWQRLIGRKDVRNGS